MLNHFKKIVFLKNAKWFFRTFLHRYCSNRADFCFKIELFINKKLRYVI